MITVDSRDRRHPDNCVPIIQPKHIECKKCYLCKCWHRINDKNGVGFCCCNPPSHIYQGMGVFPITKAGWGCETGFQIKSNEK